MKPVDIVAEWNKFHEAIREKAKQAMEEEKTGIGNDQLALPGGETSGNSAGGTDLEPRATNA